MILKDTWKKDSASHGLPIAVIPIIISLPQTYHSIVAFGVLDDIVRIFFFLIYHNFIKIPFTDVFLESKLYDCSIAAQLTTWLIFLTQTSILRFDIAALKRYTRQQSWRLFRSSFSKVGVIHFQQGHVHCLWHSQSGRHIKAESALKTCPSTNYEKSDLIILSEVDLFVIKHVHI